MMNCPKAIVSVGVAIAATIRSATGATFPIVKEPRNPVYKVRSRRRIAQPTGFGDRVVFRLSDAAYG
jgi:hypothetical protein